MVLALLFGATSVFAQHPPNILLIIAGDMGYSDLFQEMVGQYGTWVDRVGVVQWLVWR